MTEYYQIEDGILKLYTGREEVVWLPEGIHTVGEGAFKGCVSLKKVVLPIGLKRIMGDAFKGCRKLEEVIIPDGVSYIGSYAFHRCHGLKQVELPPSVEEVSECAFLYCDSLTQVGIPGVKRIGTQAFANGISLEKLVISRSLKEECICDVFTGCGRVREISFADGETFKMSNVVEAAAGGLQAPSIVHLIVSDILRMMELDGKCLVRFRVNIKHVEVPEGIKVLAKSSFFDMRGILDIRLPRSLRQIESKAFRNCISLEKVIFGSDNVQIHRDAFRNCTSLKWVITCDGAEYMFSGLSDRYQLEAGTRCTHGDVGEEGVSEPVPAELSRIPEPVRVIRKQVLGNFRISGTMLLRYLGAESRVVIPEGITRIAEEAFAGNETIDKVILPESLREIGEEAFRGCLLLQTVALPQGLCRIGAGAFESCVKLLRMDIPAGVDVLADRTFRNCRVLQQVQLGEGLREIGESVFYGCRGLKKIRLPENLAEIGRMAFYRSGLREIGIPAKAERVGSLAFAQSGLQKAFISGGHETGKYYGEDVFGDCSKLRTLVLEEGVCRIPDKFAFGCGALERIHLPQTLVSVGRHALEGTIFLERWRQGAPLETDAVFWDGRELEGSVRLGEHVRIVAGGAFYGNTKVTEIYLPEGICSVGAAAFKGCKGLRCVSWPVGVTHLEAEVFSGCEVLNAVSVPTALDGTDWARLPQWISIGERAFYRCGKLREVWLEQARRIGREAFRGCSALMGCRVNPELIVDEGAFEGTGIGEIGEDGIHIVGNLVVSGENCKGELLLPEGINGIAPYAFAGNRALKRLILPESLRCIGEGAFFGCSGLLEVVFPKKLCRIEAHAFEKCVSLREATIFAAQIGEAAFAGCIGLERIRLSKVRILNAKLFVGCAGLKNCLCENVKAVQAYCFSGCKELQDFDFSSLYVMREYAFEGCGKLRRAVFQDGVVLRSHALEGCYGLEEICLSGLQGQIHLRAYALSGCTSLQKVTYLGKDWKFGCYTDILSEVFPETVRLLFHSAFSCFEVEQEENLCGYRGAARSVRIPEGIRRIEAEVFRDVMMLENVEIPESVEYIGARAFHGTAWMEGRRREGPLVMVGDMLLDGSGCVGEVTIPADIRLVCGWAFANGIEIERIRFLSHWVRVEEYAFRNCINLREMILPDGTEVRFTGLEDREKELPPLARQAVMESMNCFKTQGAGVLMECTGNISRLRLAYGITEVGEGAFQDGNLLTCILLSDTVKKIGKRAFAGCKWLEEVREAEGVETIGDLAFSGCGALRRVELSDEFRRLGVRAFENCTALEEIRIPEGVEEIPERAFYRCHSLKNIRLPSTVKRIGREAFAFCREGAMIQVPEGAIVEERAFYGQKGAADALS